MGLTWNDAPKSVHRRRAEAAVIERMQTACQVNNPTGQLSTIQPK
jgi:hypothetical protein